MIKVWEIVARLIALPSAAAVPRTDTVIDVGKFCGECHNLWGDGDELIVVADSNVITTEISDVGQPCDIQLL